MHRAHTAWLAAALLACGDARELVGEASASLVGGGYVDDQACAECHAALYRSYREVAMSKSLTRPSVEGMIEDFENNHFYHEPSQRHFEMLQEDGEMIVRRYQLDDAGKRIHELERRVEWIVGSGNHVRSYLYRTELGELYQLPICWYSQGRTWGMAPGYEFPDHLGFNRLVGRDCLGCHNAYPELEPGSDRYGEPVLWPKEMPQGIGCQRCHGPGAEHVRSARDLDAAVEELQASIVNPARLDPDAAMQVCMQCHLQPTTRGTSIVHRFGKGAFSFRPGDRLGDHAVYIDFDDGGERDSRFEINHHGWRLRQSACRLEEGGSLSCTTCHDPHAKVPAERRAEHYRARCLECHADNGCGRSDAHGGAADTGDCVACHMPPRRPQDVIEVVMTDHLIQRSPDRDALIAPLPARGPLAGGRTELFLPLQSSSSSDARVYGAVAALRSGDLGAIDELEAALRTGAIAAVDPYADLAQAQIRAGRFEAAVKALGSGLEQAGEAAVLHTGLGFALSHLGRDDEAFGHFRRAVELEPRSPEGHFGMGSIAANRGRLGPAKQHLHEALRLRPNYAEGHFNLAVLHSRAQDWAACIHSLEQALSIDPRMGPAYLELAQALGRSGRQAEALRRLRFGHRILPSDAAIVNALALNYTVGPEAELQDSDEALRFARLGVDLAPDDAGAGLILGLALARAQRFAQVIVEVDRCLSLGADRGTCLALKAVANHQLGSRALAMQQWHEARAAPISTGSVRQWAFKLAGSLVL